MRYLLILIPFLISIFISFLIAVFYIHITFQSYLLTSIIGIVLSIIFIIQAVYYYKKTERR